MSLGINNTHTRCTTPNKTKLLLPIWPYDQPRSTNEHQNTWITKHSQANAQTELGKTVSNADLQAWWTQLSITNLQANQQESKHTQNFQTNARSEITLQLHKELYEDYLLRDGRLRKSNPTELVIVSAANWHAATGYLVLFKRSEQRHVL